MREATHPKCYLFDPGVAPRWRAARSVDQALEGRARRLPRTPPRSRRSPPPRSYALAAGVEIDFVVETRKRTARNPAHIVAVEVKRGDRWDRAWEKPLRALDAMDGVRCDRRIVVYTGPRRYRFGEVEVLPVTAFLEELHRGEVF
ncbi:MAG: hypothetical protein IPP94_01600 [Ignavibacteria bacterium]|nr:hypothetical protein [Ignavibacteria bacterium]